MLELKVKYVKDVEPIQIYDKGDWVDLRNAESIFLSKGKYYSLPLGVCIELPHGYSAIVAPRSSLFKNYGLLCANSFGIIDNSYCGDNDEWHFLVYATKDTFLFKNERICQFRLIPIGDLMQLTTVTELGNPDRGGIGSTGKE